MTDKPQSKDASHAGDDSEFFVVGNPLHAVRASYIWRRADDELFETVRQGGYAYVIAPDRSGKSSLVAATAARLQAAGVRVAIIDLGQISERDGGADAGRWYYNIAYRLLRQLRLKTDLQEWWQDKSMLSNRQRLVEFYAEVILENIQDRVVIFVDAVQCIAGLPFDEQLLASIRAAHNARATDPEFGRLTFVMLGECDPHQLVTHEGLSPFSVSRQIRLADFTREQISVFRNELNMPSDVADRALDRIYEWTRGQPFLTQKLARAVSREEVSEDVEGQVDRIARTQIAGKAALTSEPHLGHLHRAVMGDRKDCEAMLNTYGKMHKGVNVVYDPDSRPQRKLMALGLVAVGPDGLLAPRNKIYATVFTARWANENLPLHWRGPSIALAVVIAIVAIPFWYTQLLPSSHVQVLTSPVADLSDVAEAYDNLRSFPGHRNSADGLYRSLLRQRAMQATNPGQINRIGNYAQRMPDGDAFAAELQAGYWERTMRDAMRIEDRDTALIAALQSLSVPTPERRRIAANLIGDDYPNLIGTVPPQVADHMMFDADNNLLSFVNGAQVSQWSMAGDSVQQRATWTLSALEVTPLVRRLVIEQAGRVRQVSLNLLLRHERPADVRIKLIAPSGRTVELEYEQGELRDDGSLVFDNVDLSDLAGEQIAGTWSLSVRDDASAAAGNVSSWGLRLNGTLQQDLPERSLPIPDPVARESNDIWFSEGGRYVIARAVNSDSARLWDLLYAQPARPVAVPADERVLGLSSTADYMVTARLDSVNLWRISNGRRYSVLKLGSSGGDLRLSDNGRFLYVLNRGESASIFELWSVDTGGRLTSLTLPGSVALIAASADGRFLAVADYDRSVRVWDLDSKQQLAQFNLPLQPSRLALSANGSALAAIYGRQGWSLWKSDAPASPLFAEFGDSDWDVSFSPSGGRVLAGNSENGYQIVRSRDGSIAGPLLASSTSPGDVLLRFNHDESVLLTASAQGASRLWRAPAYQSTVARPAVGHRVWQRTGDTIATIATGARAIAVGDGEGHVHILGTSADESRFADASDDISFIGHSTAVTRLVFSDDGSLVASADAEGTVRVWDASTGLPRVYRVEPSQHTVEKMRFSPSGIRLAILGRQHLQIIDTATGGRVADFELNNLHRDLGFSSDDKLFVAAANGELRQATTDRTDTWALHTVWSGTAGLQNLAVSPTRGHVVIVDDNNVASLLNPADGTIGPSTMQLAGSVHDIIFSGSETRVIFRTARWVHRATIAPSGLIWMDALRAPKALRGSQMVLDAAAAGDATADALGGKIAVLTRDSGVAEIAELQFDPQSGPTIIGSREELLETWLKRLGKMPPVSR